MKEMEEVKSGTAASKDPQASRPAPEVRLDISPAWRRYALFLGVVVLCFGVALWHWMRLAVSGELYSHLPLIPFVVAYLVWLRRDALQALPFEPARWPALVLALGGVVVGLLSLTGNISARSARLDDVVFWQMLGVYLLTLAGAFWFLGVRVMKQCLFPVLILAFMLPFPHRVFLGFEIFFQHTSAEAAAFMIQLSGTPMLRQGMVFELPGITISVAPECSGIRSSLVLFITSLLAGQIFLRRPINRLILAGLVIPLAILRNGFRILTIAWLCVHVSPDMINSMIHRQGGPFFFALSLAPFFLFLILLVRRERRGSRVPLLESKAAQTGRSGNIEEHQVSRRGEH